MKQETEVFRISGKIKNNDEVMPIIITTSDLWYLFKQSLKARFNKQKLVLYAMSYWNRIEYTVFIKKVEK